MTTSLSSLPEGSFRGTRKEIDSRLKAGVKTFHIVWKLNLSNSSYAVTTTLWVKRDTQWESKRSSTLIGLAWRNVFTNNYEPDYCARDGRCNFSKDYIVFTNYWLAYGYARRLADDQRK